MDIEAIDRYIKDLQSKIDGRTISFAQNDDGAHNAAVIISMLRNASSIWMYCGAASVFSEGFFHNISKDNTRSFRYAYDEHPLKHFVSNWIEFNNTAQDVGVYLRNMMNTSLEAYLSDDSKTINIIVEDKKKLEAKTFLPSVKKSTGEFKDNVRICALNNPDFFKGLVDHFSYALKENDNLFMARMENDSESHRADCIFYPTQEIIESLEATYKNFSSVTSKL